jgi:CspA family cold shock protein
MTATNPSPAREAGTITWFNDARGFGFVTPADGSADLFVHYSGIRSTGTPYSRRTLFPGDAVTFVRSAGPDGRPLAAEVEAVGARK